MAAHDTVTGDYGIMYLHCHAGRGSMLWPNHNKPRCHGVRAWAAGPCGSYDSITDRGL